MNLEILKNNSKLVLVFKKIKEFNRTSGSTFLPTRYREMAPSLIKDKKSPS